MDRPLRQFWPPRVGWLTGLLVTATLAVNVAGVWGIAVAIRGAEDLQRRLASAHTEVRARSIERALADLRADLAFLAGSPSLLRLPALATDLAEATARREAAGSDLILFLRGHPEVERVQVRASTGAVLLEAGRPRGVPGYWLPAASPQPAAPEGSGRIAATVRVGGGLDPAAGFLDVAVDGAMLLAPGGTPADDLACRLADGAGSELFAEAGSAGPGGETAVPVAAESWSDREAWRLACVRRGQPTLALLQPLAARYRTTIALNLAVMGLAIALGAFATREARRRQAAEAQAREEARVRELERQLFHAERLGTVGRLAAGMAHEINNPLEGMANYLGLASQSLDAGDTTAARGYLGGVQEGLRRAAGIVTRVLDHARPDTAPHESVDLSEVIMTAVDFVRRREEFRGIRFELDTAPGTHVQGNALLLGQVFLNLLLNACEAQPRGGEVLARTRIAGARVVAEIADRGPGIPSQDRERVFEPFHSGKHSSGLGLSICHAIIERHEGELSLAEREGGGTVFRVSLAAAPLGGGATDG